MIAPIPKSLIALYLCFPSWTGNKTTTSVLKISFLCTYLIWLRVCVNATLPSHLQSPCVVLLCWDKLVPKAPDRGASPLLPSPCLFPLSCRFTYTWALTLSLAPKDLLFFHLWLNDGVICSLLQNINQQASLSLSILGLPSLVDSKLLWTTNEFDG